MNKNYSERQIWIDVIKVLACFLVIMQHSISAEWVSPFTDSGQISTTWTGINAIFILAKTGVPLFFMCSGVVMLRREHTISKIWRHNIPTILIPYASWMLVYGAKDIISLSLGGNLSIRTAVNAVIKDILFGQYHTWFIAALLALYVICPFLYKIASDIKLERYFLLLSILFTVVFPYIGKAESLSRVYSVITDTHMTFVTGYTLYFVMGHYLSSLRTRKGELPALLCILAGSYTAAFAVSGYAAVNGMGGDTQTIYTEFSFLGLILNLCIFRIFRLLFQNMTSDQKGAGIICALADYGFAMYLMHPLFLGLVEYTPDLMAIFGGVIIWMVSAGISAVIAFSPLHQFLIGKTKAAR